MVVQALNLRTESSTRCQSFCTNRKVEILDQNIFIQLGEGRKRMRLVGAGKRLAYRAGRDRGIDALEVMAARRAAARANAFGHGRYGCVQFSQCG